MIYKNKQIATAILVILAFIMSFVLMAFVLTGGNPAVVFFMVLLVAFGYLFHGLTVEVTSSNINWFFGPSLGNKGLIGKSLSFEDIDSAEVVINSWAHGLGVKISHDGWVYAASGFKAVNLKLHDGTCIRIGSPEPEKLSAVINKQLSN